MLKACSFFFKYNKKRFGNLSNSLTSNFNQSKPDWHYFAKRYLLNTLVHVIRTLKAVAAQNSFRFQWHHCKRAIMLQPAEQLTFLTNFGRFRVMYE